MPPQQISYQGQTSTVCSTGFTEAAAGVVCGELGFSSGRVLPQSATPTGGTGTVLVGGVNCAGYEQSVKDCTNTWWTDSGCTHGDDVGVVCIDAPANGELYCAVSVDQ